MADLISTPAVYFIGLGALGILYAKIIEDGIGPDSVTFVADKKRIKRYREQPVSLNGVFCHFNYAAPAEITKKADYLFFAVKGTALEQAIALAAPIVDDKTIIISLLNGISSEKLLEEAFPQANVLYCIGQKMDAFKLDSNVICRDKGELCIGIPKTEKDNPKLQEALDKTVSFFKSIGLPFVLEKDILHRLWCKWMLNVGVNQAVMINEGTFKTVQSEGEPRNTMISAMREVMALSRKNGINIVDSEFDQYLKIIDGLNPEGMPSMRQDGLNRRKSEVELFAGTVLDIGKKLGVPTPTNAMIYDTIQKIQSKY